MHIINAGILSNDSRECATVAKSIYKGFSRGMWKNVQFNARKVLRLATEHGLTIERPYKVIAGRVWAIVGCDFLPI